MSDAVNMMSDPDGLPPEQASFKRSSLVPCRPLPTSDSSTARGRASHGEHKAIAKDGGLRHLCCDYCKTPMGVFSPTALQIGVCLFHRQITIVCVCCGNKMNWFPETIAPVPRKK